MIIRYLHPQGHSRVSMSKTHSEFGLWGRKPYYLGTRTLWGRDAVNQFDLCVVVCGATFVWPGSGEVAGEPEADNMWSWFVPTDERTFEASL